MSQQKMSMEEFKAMKDAEFASLVFSPTKLKLEDIKTSRDVILDVNTENGRALTDGERERIVEIMQHIPKSGYKIRLDAKYDKITKPFDMSVAKMGEHIKAYALYLGKNPSKHEQAILDNGGKIITVSKDMVDEINLGLGLTMLANPTFKMEYFDRRPAFGKKILGVDALRWLNDTMKYAKPAIILVCTPDGATKSKGFSDNEKNRPNWDELSYRAKDNLNYAQALQVEVVNIANPDAVETFKRLIELHDANFVEEPISFDEPDAEDKEPVPDIDIDDGEIPF